jgi:hypothetical protein
MLLKPAQGFLSLELALNPDLYTSVLYFLNIADTTPSLMGNM